MGVRIYLGMTAVNTQNEEIFTIKSTDPCDGLCLMLFNKGEDYVMGHKLSEILTETEMAFLNITYGRESGSVAEGYESFKPHTIAYENLGGILGMIDKIIRFLSAKVIEKINQPQALNVYRYDIYALKEIRTALHIAWQTKANAYLFINDY